MIEPTAFAELFRGQAVPDELSRLLTFQNEVDTQYSRGLHLALERADGLENGWSSEPAFLERLVAFAVASASGSFYALWNPQDGSAPSQWPVIAFGDEGGEWVVASHARELLQLAALDVEPTIMYDRAYFYVGEDDDDEDQDDGSDALHVYRKWLHTTFGLEAVKDPDLVVKAAQERWQAPFDAWKDNFLG